MAEKARAKVALPKIPPWSAPTPASLAKAAESQRKREEAKNKAGGTVTNEAVPNGLENGKLAKLGGESSPKKLDSELVNKRVRITNILNKSFTGTVYSCDNSELVLSTAATEYHIIPIAKIKSFEVLEDKSNNGMTQNHDASREKEKQSKAAEEREKKLAKPPGVSAVGHALFLGLEKTLPVRWDDRKIIVLNSVTIEPPYDADDCKAPQKNQKQLERVKELVKKERERVAGRRGG